MGSSLVHLHQPGLWQSNFGGEMVAKSTEKRHNNKEKKKKKAIIFYGGSSSYSYSSLSHLVIIKNNHKTCNFTYNSAHNVPLHHFPGHEACFDQYMEDKGRVIRSIIPEKATLKRLNQEVWRIRMPVMEALFLRVEPVIDVRVRTKSNGENYPSHIPPHITKLFEAHTIKLELQGVPAHYMPPLFNMEATGTLYPQTQGSHSFINNQINANITIVFPTLLSWVPEHVLNDLLHSIITKVVEDIKRGYTVRLLSDYRSFQRSKSKN